MAMQISLYIFVGALVLYVLVATRAPKLNAIPSALLVVGAPFALRTVVSAIILSGKYHSLDGLLSITDIVTVVLQLAAAYVFFSKLRQIADEVSFEAWMVWVFGGGIMLFLAIPYFVTSSM